MHTPDLRQRRYLMGILVGFALLAGCREETVTPRPAQAGPLKVYVSIAPQKYFVEKVGQSLVNVYALLKPGHSPVTYEPSAKQIIELGTARVYFRTGLPFENHVVDKIQAGLKNLTVVDLREGITLLADSQPCDHDDEDHPAAHDDHGHDHDGIDRHIWMSPRLVKVQARTICRTLAELDPVHRPDYERNRDAFLAELDRIDAEIAAALAPLRGKAFYVFHPAFGYFARDYNLRQVAVETGGKEPAARQLQTLIDQARSDGVKLIFVQPQFSRHSAQAVAQAIGGSVVPLDPLAEDYLTNLRTVAAAIQKTLTAPAPPSHEGGHP